jgi:predicted lipoprotein with Yx(FWY)xxD motif
MQRTLRQAMLVPALVVVVLLVACGGGTSASGAATVHTKSVKVSGKSVTVLADANGKTLYYFMLDSPKSIACNGSCAQNWPPLLASSGAPTSAAALPGRLGVTRGANGRQVTYNGHPLYRYTKDGDAGDAYGQGVGGKWFVATPGLAAGSGPASGG